MKRIVLAGLLTLAASCAFAYNPAFGGESLFKLNQPQMLTEGSASGGPLFSVSSSSIVYNPALPAGEQRTIVNLTGSAIVDSFSADGNQEVGWGIQSGVVVPTRYVVFSGNVSGMFQNNPAMQLGNSIVVHLGVSKEMTERLSVGANIYTGFYFGHGNDLSVGADLGAVYRIEKLGFLRDVRIAAALLNMGMPMHSGYQVNGIDGSTSNVSFPGIFTPRASFAATLFTVGNHDNRLVGGFSADFSFPSFQNMIFETSFGLSFRDFVFLNVGWDANIRELSSGARVNLPSVGLGFKIVISSGAGSSDWKKSELIPTVGWQNINKDFHDISAGVTVFLGQEDDIPPQIILWDDEADF